MQANESSAETFVASLRTISPPERRKHASVYNYWQSIRRDRQFPPIRDLDPLEISDAGPFSLLLEMIGGGEDAEIRHIGHAIKNGVQVEKVGQAPNPSLLSCIASRLPVVAACREAFAFEDEFETADGKTRCWVTLLPFSASGTWIDYVYGFVTLDAPPGAGEVADDDVGEDEPVAEEAASVEEILDATAAIEPYETDVEPVTDNAEPVTNTLEPAGIELPAEEPSGVSDDDAKPTLSEKLFEKLSNIGGFYGRPVEIELDPDTVSLETWEAEEPDATDELAPAEELAPADEPAVADEQDPADELDDAEAEQEPSEALTPGDDVPAEDESSAVDQPSPSYEPTPMSEETLQSKLTEVREKADEARQAKLRANVALYEGLSAAYDFALDAEEAPEEYLRLLEVQGLKIQLRSPMKPVVKLAFNGMCDDATIKQLEAVLAWAFEAELPRGTLADRIETEGGIGPILNGLAEAA
ncbi:MAG TPA: hypothetical protein VGM04_04160 [Sphingomicrobium sp.]